jgi:hypothetical protein
VPAAAAKGVPAEPHQPPDPTTALPAEEAQHLPLRSSPKGLVAPQLLHFISVVDPHHFDADLDSIYHPDVDLDADPDSDFYLMEIQIRIFI